MRNIIITGGAGFIGSHVADLLIVSAGFDAQWDGPLASAGLSLRGYADITRKLIGYAGLAPKINQSGDRSRTGALSKAGSRTLRWAAVEAAQHAWRESNPWHQLYSDIAARAGKNPAKAAVARKILIASWHILSRQQPFKAPANRRPDPASASSRCFLAA